MGLQGLHGGEISLRCRRMGGNRESSGQDGITPLVPFTVSMGAVTHSPVNLRRDTHRATGTGLHWSRINAGSRTQMELPGTTARHFRVGSASVKCGEAVVSVARSFRLPPVLPL